MHGVALRYVAPACRSWRQPDLIILPGTKSTMDDLLWLRQNGLEAAIRKPAAAGVPVLGICGGYQMLGQTARRPRRGGGRRHALRGHGAFALPPPSLQGEQDPHPGHRAPWRQALLPAAKLDGYEIHMGRTRRLTDDAAAPFARLSDGREEGTVAGQVFGTYLHGLFDTGELTAALARWLLNRKGLDLAAVGKPVDRNIYRQQQYDRLAEALEQHLDLTAIWRAMEERCHG